MSLYRKYRPATFSEVVGQEQVTRPLATALDAGRINHAYLFSGPRGCGKTSSARILARSLNCVEGPTSQPCGVCESCRALAPGGPGNLDVTELDAATHNGVDDMRELRDRAYYAPADSRYRVFIIDEAHMISNAGSNALLKIVEEPPEHLVFIFATTEPEKVIGTIRSRTHHYPFRLLTPQAMRGLLERTVRAEGARVEDAVYPLVISAGGGSPRDSLSILDQLLAGAGPHGLTYQQALPLLGVTDLSIMDAAVEALADGDGARLYATLDEVIETGIEPRRFVMDLLDRLRDLMVLQAVPDAFAAGLVQVPADRQEKLSAQAQRFAPGRVAYLADEVNRRIPDMRGATSPRLLLEILCAHLLLAVTQQQTPLAGAPAPATAAGASAGPEATQPPGRAPAAATAARPGESRVEQARRELAERRGERPPEQSQRPQQQSREQPPGQPTPVEPASQRGEPQHTPRQPAAAAPSPQPESPATHPAVPPADPQDSPRPEPTERKVGGAEGAEGGQPEPASPPAPPDEPIDVVRKAWPQVRATMEKRNTTIFVLMQEAMVSEITDGTLVLNHYTGALANRLNVDPHNAELKAVVREVTGLDLAVRFDVTSTRRLGTAQNRTERERNASGGRTGAPRPRETRRTSPTPPSPATESRQGEISQPAAGPRRSWKAEPPQQPPSSPPASAGEPHASPRSSHQPAAPQGAPLPEEAPLPPEPYPEDEAPPETPADDVPARPAASPSEGTYSHTEEDEEAQLIEEAQGPRISQDRSPLEVAADLIVTEFNARRV